MYVFQLFDYYAASGMCLLFMSIFETVCIAWVYGKAMFNSKGKHCFIFLQSHAKATKNRAQILADRADAWSELWLNALKEPGRGTAPLLLSHLFLCVSLPQEYFYCFCRSRSILWQHRGHDWLPSRSLHQVLLEVSNPGHVHCEFHQSDNNLMAYYSTPCRYFKYLFSSQGTFAFSLIKYTPLKYNNEYVYPWWGYVIGWLLALSSMVCIPLWMVYKIGTSQGTIKEVWMIMYKLFLIWVLKNLLKIFLQRIQLLITPSDSLPKTKREQERLLATFSPEDVANTTNGYHPVPERDSNLWTLHQQYGTQLLKSCTVASRMTQKTVALSSSPDTHVLKRFGEAGFLRQHGPFWD